MASGFFALLDDIAALMDDVASMSKVAAKKTAGILGDDLAVNAEKSSGFVSSRELPVLWAIGKGSILNKIIILPLAFLLSAFWPLGVTIVLIMGGLYLAYEGAEKIIEYIFHRSEKLVKVDDKSNMTKAEIVALEKGKIKSAIITDFILSVEIVIITLGTVLGESLLKQVIVVTIIALVATIGVYGIVALIVRLDDMGFAILKGNEEKRGFKYYLGTGLVKSLPIIIKGLTIIGTLALFLVAGGIFVHKIEFFHHILENIPGMLRDFIVGLSVGLACAILMIPIKMIWKKMKPTK